MMRRYILLVIMVVSTVYSFADNQMNIHLEGEVVSFPFEKKPIVTFHNEEMTVTTVAAERSFTLSDVKKITYCEGDVPTEISAAAISSGISLNGNTVIVSGLNSNEIITLYSTSGALLDNKKADASGIAVINPVSLPHGVIIVTTSKASFKINN